jgi:23S rRNA pseudouridine2605 synthase
MERVRLSDTVRINRYLSLCGIASRRAAEELVVEGHVTVNGKRVTSLATRIHPDRDRVTVRGKTVHPVRKYRYLVMNKPRDAISTAHDEKGRRTVLSLVRSEQRLFTVGRLDRNTTGVILLTNDGDLAHRLMHPSTRIQKSYIVTCDRPVDPHHLERLRSGLVLDGKKTAPADAGFIPGSKGKSVGIVLHEGRYRQVRRMFEQLGYEVEKLDRIAYGPIDRRGLGRGETRSLTRAEIRQLKALAGMTEF